VCLQKVNLKGSFLASFLRQGSHCTSLGESCLLLRSVCFGNTNSVVIAIEDCVEFSHEYIANQEHFLLDIHLHYCGGTNSLWAVTVANLSVCRYFS